jgi:hypothetical protein
MSNNIAVITQTQIDPEDDPITEPTMALPHWAAVLDTKFPKKKLIQGTLKWGNVAVATPSPEHDLVEVESHYRGSTKVQAHKRKINIKSDGNKKKGKTKKSKQNTEAIPKVTEECKESVQLAHSLHIQEMKSLINSFKK